VSGLIWLVGWLVNWLFSRWVVLLVEWFLPGRSVDWSFSWLVVQPFDS